jgi:anti-sigma-K factor RskA
MSNGQRQIWDDASVGEFALGVMPYAERLRFAADLKNERSLQLRLAVWEESFAPMTSELADLAVPPMVLTKIEKRLFSAAKPVSLFQRLRFWQAATLVGFGALALSVAVPRLAPVDAPSLVAVIQGVLSISRKQGSEAADEDFELWVIAAGSAPVSIGVLKDGDTTVITVPEALKGVMDGATLAITNEPVGGSPTGQPTGTILGTGTILQI